MTWMTAVLFRSVFFSAFSVRVADMFYPPFFGGGGVTGAKGQGSPWMSRQLITDGRGTQVPTAHQE